MKLMDVEPARYGYWIEYEHANGFYCSKCRFKVKEREAKPHKRWNHKLQEYVEVKASFQFCPHCGSKIYGVIECD